MATDSETIGSISDAAERNRLEALHALGILDSPFEERFDRITRLAAAVFGVPTAAVSLVDVNRQWFKSCVGLEDREGPLELSLCAIAIRGDGQLVIEDASADPRFARHPAVDTEDGVRFYAGQPLRLPGGEIPGTLCVFDSRPREFGESERAVLRELAELVERELVSEGVEELLADLVRTTARVAAVADAAAEGILVLTPSGRVEFANAAAERMLGYGEGGLADVDLHAALHSEDAACDDGCPLGSAIAAVGRHPMARENFRRADGACLPVEVTAEPVVERGDVTGLVLTFADITERLELERVKDEFAANVTHDLRSPLQTIRGYTQLARELGDVGEEARGMLDRVLRGTERLENLIDDLLTVSRLEGAEGPAERAPVDVARLAESLAESAAGAAAGRSVRIHVEAPTSVVVEGDRGQLERALANLVSNAVKFSPDGGLVTVRVGSGDGLCRFEVTDEGPGIPADELDRLGERFFRASTSAGVQGTGLGLTITREVAESHGGGFRVDSELGAGSTFVVELPLPA